MTHEFPPEVDEMIRKQLDTGNYESQDDVLLAALRSLEGEQEDWAAVSEALDSLERGEPGLSLEEAFESVRRKHGIPADA
jgi:putative addiction module CopG family antidote